MNHDEFAEKYLALLEHMMDCSEKAMREGLLSLEKDFDEEKIAGRDIFEYGMGFVTDGTDSSMIDKILSNIIAQEKDEYFRILKTIQKEAVLAIQEGLSPRVLVHLLTSYTDLPFSDERLRKIAGRYL